LTQPGGVICIACGGGIIVNGNLGGACLPADTTVPIPHCNDGYGCNKANNTCQACGGDGQPCCDGPHSAFSGKCYIDPLHPHSCDVCHAGSCEAASHLCHSCGSTAGGACCAPDAAIATYRCHGSLACDPTHTRCIACGAPGQPTCDEQPLCNASAIDDGAGHCVACGGNGQPPCSTGCQAGLEEWNGVCTPICGHTGGACCGGNTCHDRHDACISGTCQTEGYYDAPCIAEYCNNNWKCMYNNPFDYTPIDPVRGGVYHFHEPARLYNICGVVEPNSLLDFYRHGYPGDSKRGDIIAYALEQNYYDNNTGKLTQVGACGQAAWTYYKSEEEYCSEFVRDMYLWRGDVPDRCYCATNILGACVNTICVSSITKVSDWEGMFRAYGGWIDRSQVSMNTPEPGDYLALNHGGHSALIVGISVDGRWLWTQEGNVHYDNGPGCVRFQYHDFFVNGQLAADIDGIGKANVLF
jgi:hypothetical protein